ncbi:MAG: hypothetical protein RLZZ546_1948 [Bacteroidota bacterium]|jgi:hypothetical protein
MKKEFTDYDGDIYCYYFENKEWYDWIFTNDTTPLKTMSEALLKNESESSYYKLKTINDVEEFFTKNLKPHSRTFENDKALELRFCAKEAPETVKETVIWLKENNFEIDEEYEGMIY